MRDVASVVTVVVISLAVLGANVSWVMLFLVAPKYENAGLVWTVAIRLTASWFGQ